MKNDKPPTRDRPARDRPVKDRLYPWRELILKEAYVIVIGAGTLTGTIAFFAIMTYLYPELPLHWLWLSLVAAGLLLPNVYNKLKNSQDPYLIRFAQAFRVGFLSWSPLSFGGTTWWFYLVEFWSQSKQMPKDGD